MTSFRSLAILAALVTLPAPAAAADLGLLPALRGSIIEAPPSVPLAFGRSVDWGGVYAGGLAGWGSSSGTLGGSSTLDALGAAYIPGGNEAQPYTPHTLPGTSASATGMGFGAFVGYQVPFEDTVIGIEADYMRLGLKSTIGNTIPYVPGLPQGPNATGNFSQTKALARRIDDIMTLRLRAGWAPGNFMLYATGGLAYARGQQAGALGGVYVDGADSGKPAYTVQTFANSFSGFGYAYGLGVETLLANTFMLRAEYLGATFSNLGGQKQDVHMVRAGVGFKFGGGGTASGGCCGGGQMLAGN